MAGSESVEQNKPQEGAKDEAKKTVEIKEEDLVCRKKNVQTFLHRMNFIFSRKKINN